MAATRLNRPDLRPSPSFGGGGEGQSGSFVQGLKQRQSAGLALLGHVAADGIWRKAEASCREAMTMGG